MISPSASSWGRDVRCSWCPYAGTFKTVGQRVLVAWNAGREATRAVNDALPLLRGRLQGHGAGRQSPRRASTGTARSPARTSPCISPGTAFRAEASALKSDDVEIGALLLSQAADLDADLIVMGAYGHSRLRELVLGGATREILRSMTVPVLLSH